MSITGVISHARAVGSSPPSRVWRLNHHQESWDPIIALGHFKYGDSFCFFSSRGPLSACRSHWLQAGWKWMAILLRKMGIPWRDLGPWDLSPGTTSWRTCCLIPCWATAGDGAMAGPIHIPNEKWGAKEWPRDSQLHDSCWVTWDKKKSWFSCWTWPCLELSLWCSIFDFWGPWLWVRCKSFWGPWQRKIAHVSVDD